MKTTRSLAAAAFAVLASVTACSSTQTVVAPTPLGGTPITGQAQSVSFSDPGLISGSVNFPAPTALLANDTVSIVAASSPPSGDPVVDRTLPKLPSLHRMSSNTTNVPLAYLMVTFSQTTAYSAYPGFTLSVGGVVNPANGQIFIAFLDPTKTPAAYEYGIEGPATTSGGAANLSGPSASVSFSAGVTYVFSVYQAQSGSTTPTPVPTPTPTPTASPSPTPTPTPPPPNVLSVNPNAISLYGTGTQNAQNISVQETGYSGAFSESDTCNPNSGTIATIATGSAAGPSATYAVTGFNAGTCSATFSDTNGQHITIPVSVTTTGFGVQIRR